MQTERKASPGRTSRNSESVSTRGNLEWDTVCRSRSTQNARLESTLAFEQHVALELRIIAPGLFQAFADPLAAGVIACFELLLDICDRNKLLINHCWTALRVPGRPAIHHNVNRRGVRDRAVVT